MRPQKVGDEEILTGLAKVFRSKGYEGASLKDLAEATGLKKASLYHRFPEGKEGMANAVLEFLGAWVEMNIFHSLTDQTHQPEVRLKNGLRQIKNFYNDGKVMCIFRALSMQVGLQLFEQQINQGLALWINSFEELGLALGQSPKQANNNALQTIIDIQGSLIVSRGLNDISVFDDTIQRIEDKYLM